MNPTTPTPGEASGDCGADGALRILVVDDNLDAAESLSTTLRLRGHAVRTAHDGAEGLLSAAQWRPEAVLLDIGMPGLSGHEVARRLRAEPGNAGLLLVAVTGWGSADDQRQSLAAGFDHHLTKPVDLAALDEVLARHPRNPRRQRNDAAAANGTTGAGEAGQATGAHRAAEKVEADERLERKPQRRGRGRTRADRSG